MEILKKVLYRPFFFLSSFYLKDIKNEISHLINSIHENMNYVIEHISQYSEQQRSLLFYMSEMSIVASSNYAERYELHYIASPNTSVIMYRPYQHLMLEFYFYLADKKDNAYSLFIHFTKKQKAIYEQSYHFFLPINKKQLEMYLEELTSIANHLKTCRSHIEYFSYLENDFHYENGQSFPKNQEMIEKYYSMIDSEKSDYIFMTYMAYLKNHVAHQNCSCYEHKIQEIKNDIEQSYINYSELIVDVNYKPSPPMNRQWTQMMSRKLDLLDHIDLFILKHNLSYCLDEQEETPRSKI